MKNYFKVFFSLLFFFFLFLSMTVHKIESKEMKKEKINFKSIHYNVKISQKEWDNKSLKERLEGKWTDNEVEYGSTFIKLIFSSDHTAKLQFVDVGYLRGADFETTVTFNEEVKDKLYTGNFTWDSTNGGIGYISVNDYDIDLILTETKPGGGAYNMVYPGHYTFSRPYTPSFPSTLETIQEKISMQPEGYLPNESVTYRYKTLDGFSHRQKIYNVAGSTIYGTKGYDQESIYTIKPNGIYQTYKYDKEKSYLILPFGKKEGFKWKYDDTPEEIVDTNYTLYGLKNIIVIKSGTGKDAEYELYHKNFGLIGWAEKSGKKYIPTYLLDSVDY